MKKLLLILLGIVFTLTANSQTYWRYRDSLLIKGTADSITFYKPLVFPAATLQGGLGYIYGTKNANSGLSVGQDANDLINIYNQKIYFRSGGSNLVQLDAVTNEFSPVSTGTISLGTSGYSWQHIVFEGNLTMGTGNPASVAKLDTIYGGAASGGNLFLGSTTHATKGKIYLDTTAVVDCVNDRLGIGTASPSYQLHAVGVTDAANVGYLSLTSVTTGANSLYASLTSKAATGHSGYNRTAIYAYAVDDPDTTSNRDLHGILGKCVTTTDSVAHGSLYALRFSAEAKGKGTTAGLYGVLAYPYMDAAATVTNAYAYYSYPWATNGTYTNWYGLSLGTASLSGGAAITNLRGIAISDYSAGTNNTGILIGTGTTGNWAIYSSDTDSSYLGGGLRLTNLYATGDVSALTFTDRTSAYNGDALGEIMKTRTDDNDAYHNTIPEFAKHDGGVDIGAMTAVLLKAVQQLKTENDSLKVMIKELKK